MSALVDPVDSDTYYLKKARPCLKWVGGKTQLKDVILKEIDRLHPGPIDTYYEPFAGGLAVFFALVAAGRIKHAHLCDTNADLINFYVQVQRAPEALIEALRKLKKRGFTEERYYEVRASKPRSPAARAARLLYLNKCGFNGLYRVNQKGEFNVPWGHRKTPPEICDEEGILAAHHALRCAAVYVSDFRSTLSDMHATLRGAPFVYLDPPYWPTQPTASFTSYTAGDFKASDQHELADYFRRLALKNVPALLSNSDVPDTRKLYRDFKRKRVSARRSVNSVGTGRGAVSELLVESTFKKAK